MNILFICNQNQNRSITAQHLFKDKFNTMSAGLYNKTPVTVNQLSWANIIIVMEEHQRNELSIRFPKHYLNKQILCLDIPDIYYKDQPELKKILKSKMHYL